jgi:hypothetical protein
VAQSATVTATDLQPLDVFSDGMGDEIQVKEIHVVGDYVDVIGEDVWDGDTVTYRFRRDLRIDVERDED